MKYPDGKPNINLSIFGFGEHLALTGRVELPSSPKFCRGFRNRGFRQLPPFFRRVSSKFEVVAKFRQAIVYFRSHGPRDPRARARPGRGPE